MTSNRHLWTTLLTVVILLAATTTLVAQTESTGGNKIKCGLTAAVQSGQVDISVPLWFTQTFVLAPTFYLTNVSDHYSDWGLGIALRFNLHTGKAVPYAGARVGILEYNPQGADGAEDVVFGPMFGGEYFLDPHFSLGVEAQVNITKSGDKSYRFNNPGGMTVNTATMVSATFYF